MTPDLLTYKKQDILDVLKQLNGIVVSLDRLTSAHVDLPAGLWKEAVFEYFLTSKALQSLPECRSILSAPFSRELEADDMDELERNAEASEYWSFKEFVSKRQRSKT